MSILNRFFGIKKDNRDSPSPGKSIPPKGVAINEKLKFLLEKHRSNINPSHPLLRKGYDQISKVKGADYSKWIIEQLRDSDFIALLAFVEMLYNYTGVLSNSPREGTNEYYDSVRLKEGLTKFLESDFQKYLNISETIVNEIKAYFILNYGMEREGRQFWIVVAEKTIMLSKVLSIHSFSIHKKEIKKMVTAANKFIKEQKDDGGWEEYPYYEIENVEADYDLITGAEFLEKIQQLSVCERVHFFDFAKHADSGPYWMGESSYNTKILGINEEASLNHLMELGLFKKVEEIESIPFVASKADLKELAEKAGFDIKKSWTLAKIYTHLINAEGGKKFLWDYISDKTIYRFEIRYMEDLQVLLDYQEKLILIADLLVFI